jgi:hypothetical protein
VEDKAPIASLPHAPPPAVRVVYERGAGRAGQPVVVGGRRCALRLEPDRDVRGAAVVLDLTLRCRGFRHGEDLLSSAYRWHGLQPFIFPARDMVGGPKSSIEDNARISARPSSARS